MSSTMSKRQHARNERALQELIKTVPGNNVCADCQARNPGMLMSLHVLGLSLTASKDGQAGMYAYHNYIVIMNTD